MSTPAHPSVEEILPAPTTSAEAIQKHLLYRGTVISDEARRLVDEVMYPDSTQHFLEKQAEVHQTDVEVKRRNGTQRSVGGFLESVGDGAAVQLRYEYNGGMASLAARTFLQEMTMGNDGTYGEGAGVEFSADGYREFLEYLSECREEGLTELHGAYGMLRLRHEKTNTPLLLLIPRCEEGKDEGLYYYHFRGELQRVGAQRQRRESAYADVAVEGVQLSRTTLKQVLQRVRMSGEEPTREYLATAFGAMGDLVAKICGVVWKFEKVKDYTRRARMQLDSSLQKICASVPGKLLMIMEVVKDVLFIQDRSEDSKWRAPWESSVRTDMEFVRRYEKAVQRNQRVLPEADQHFKKASRTAFVSKTTPTARTAVPGRVLDMEIVQEVNRAVLAKPTPQVRWVKKATDPMEYLKYWWKPAAAMASIDEGRLFEKSRAPKVAKQAASVPQHKEPAKIVERPPMMEVPQEELWGGVKEMTKGVQSTIKTGKALLDAGITMVKEVAGSKNPLAKAKGLVAGWWKHMTTPTR